VLALELRFVVQSRHDGGDGHIDAIVWQQFIRQLKTLGVSFDHRSGDGAMAVLSAYRPFRVRIPFADGDVLREACQVTSEGISILVEPIRSL